MMTINGEVSQSLDETKRYPSIWAVYSRFPPSSSFWFGASSVCALGASVSVRDLTMASSSREID
jgi:hypothetical protein